MAITTGTFTTYPSIGNREQLLDAIYRISPEETPFMSAIGRKKATATKIEWQTDALAAAAANAQLEGDEYSFSTPTATARVGNFCQISRKEVIISGTEEVIDKAGRKSEIGYQMEKRTAELKRDMEFAFVGSNQASVAGNTTTARRSGSLSSWLTSNVSRGASGANGGYSSGTGLTVAATDGTQRAFAEAQLKTVMQSAFTNGGKPTLAIMSPGQKVNFSAFAGIATNRVDNAPAKSSESQMAIFGAADVYKSDFGNLTAVPDIFSRTRDVYLVDPRYASVAYLRPFTRDVPAKTGDAEKRVVLVEYSLVCDNEAAHGVVADLT
jgi:hypothetical protein